MLLHGSIQRFGLASVLQYLAQNTATGVLEVRDFEEYGFVYLVDGSVEGISMPITDDKLGTYLVKAGCLTQQQLSEALMEDSALTHDEKRLKPLGQRLIEKGFTSEAKIREAVGMRTLEQVFELAHWRNGVFTYEEPEEMPSFQVKIQGDVQELLLDAQRRIDEGHRARKAVAAVGNELCFACTLADECTPEIKARHLKTDVCLWRTMSAVVDDDHSGIRDARELYRSEEEDAKAMLDPSLNWQ